MRTLHSNTVVVAVDGACRNNGFASARAASGVFVEYNNEYNLSTPVVGIQMNQIAELFEGIQGVGQAIAIAKPGLS